MNTHLSEVALIFTSLFIQGLPFLIFGALVSGLVSAFLPIQQWIAWMPRHPLPSALLGILAGFIFPSCECIGLPLVRRLTIKGLPLSAGLAYLFASPAINPIALTSTWLAFSFEDPLVATLLRLSGSALIALIIALALHRLGPTLCCRPEVISPSANEWSDSQPSALSAPWLQQRFPRLAQALQLSVLDFFNIALFYSMGVLIASLAQTFAADLLDHLSHGAGAIPFMMLSAIISSLCSSSDAFVAKSYFNMSLPALMAFLWIGPVLDLKLLFIYHSFFQKRALLILSSLALLTVLALAMGLQQLPPHFFSHPFQPSWSP
jgi:uncharacterized protein